MSESIIIIRKSIFKADLLSSKKKKSEKQYLGKNVDRSDIFGKFRKPSIQLWL